MPHTNRRKKTANLVHTKRTQVEDSDGWTHVVDAKKGDQRASLKKDAARSNQQVGTVVSGNTKYEFAIMSYEEIETEHQRVQRQWEASEDEARLKKLLASYSEKHNITRVVCLGLGSLQNLSQVRRRTAHTQLLALQTITAALGVASVRHIAQEPLFTDLDKKFLVSQGFEIMDDPEAVSHIDGQSLVYALHCGWGLYQAVGQQPPCALLIGNEIEHYLEHELYVVYFLFDPFSGFPSLIQIYADIEAIYPIQPPSKILLRTAISSIFHL